ncbi:MAG: transporter substrate-binding domain-containing protein [Pseudobdellovibrio sp.]
MFFKTTNFFTFSFFLLMTLSSAKVFAKEKILTLHYAERPPYAVTDLNGQAYGLFSTPIVKALKKAKIPFLWVKTPINRQFLLLKENKNAGDDPVCAVGYYKTSEREKFTKFSKPYYLSKGLVVVTGIKIKKKKDQTFENFMKNHTIILKENYSYGPEVDALLLKLNPNKVTTPGEAEQMIEMVTLGHGDYIVMSREEIDYYIKKGSAKKTLLSVLTFSDLPKGLFRYLMCSKSVSDQAMDQINKNITFKPLD